jgi:hypothetical protein
VKQRPSAAGDGQRSTTRLSAEALIKDIDVAVFGMMMPFKQD